MTEITLYEKSSAEIFEIIRDLRSHGLEPNRDFDYKFYQKHWDVIDGEITKLHTIFCFYDEKYATLFNLKYSCN